MAVIGGFPSGDGDAYAELFELVHDVTPFPGSERFEGPDIVDLDDRQRQSIAA